MRLVVVVMVVLLVALLLVQPGTTRAAQIHLSVTATATLVVGSSLGPISPYFWGLNAQIKPANAFTVNSLVGGFLNASGDPVIRLGGGSDSCNETSNTFWTPGTSSGVPSTGCLYSISSFKAWCDSFTPHCSWVAQLPGENNNSAEDANIANDIVNVKGIQPTWFAIGNEPDAWTHYGIPWASWTTSDASTPTATDYAWDVKNAITAVKAVVPTAKFIGIEASSCVQTAFPTAVATLDGNQLSAFACHQYPHGVPGTPKSITTYFTALTATTAQGSANITNGYEKFRSIVAGLCTICSTLPVQIGEYNGGTAGVSAPAYNQQFSGATFLAASAAQALNYGIPSFQPFALQGSGVNGPYYMLNTSTSNMTDAQGYFYESFVSQLDSGTVYNTTVASSATNLWATEIVSGGVTRLLFVNANATTTSVSLSLSGMFSPERSGSSLSYYPGGSVLSTTYADVPPLFVVPSQGILEITQSTNGGGTGTGNSTCGGVGQPVCHSTNQTTNGTPPSPIFGTIPGDLQLAAGIGAIVIGLVVVRLRSQSEGTVVVVGGLLLILLAALGVIL